MSSLDFRLNVTVTDGISKPTVITWLSSVVPSAQNVVYTRSHSQLPSILPTSTPSVVLSANPSVVHRA
eukprot:gene36306-44790_t